MKTIKTINDIKVENDILHIGKEISINSKTITAVIIRDVEKYYTKTIIYLAIYFGFGNIIQIECTPVDVFKIKQEIAQLIETKPISTFC